MDAERINKPLSRKLRILKGNGRSSDLLAFEAFPFTEKSDRRFQKPMVSLQQRELYRFCTRFPIMPSNRSDGLGTITAVKV
jgi:hypothetical protein